MEEMPQSFPCAAAEQSPHPTNGTPFVGYPTTSSGIKWNQGASSDIK